MLKVAMICMLVAVVILAVSVSLMKKNSSLTFLLKVLALIALVSLGFIVANYKDNFSGFSILLILGIMPMFLSTFDLKQMLETKKKETAQAQDIPAEEEIAEQSENPKEKPKKKGTKTHFLNFLVQSNGNILSAIGLFLSAICISISTLYIGKESVLGFGIGLLVGLAVTFVMLSLGKLKNPFDATSFCLFVASAGLMLGNIILAFMYSFAITNILFCLGALLFGAYAVLQTKFNKNYFNPIYYASVILFFLSILL